MKIYKAVAIIVFIFTPMVMSNVHAQEQEGLSRKDKLRMLDREIELAQQEKKDGVLKLVAGVGATLVGYAFLPWTETTLDADWELKTEEHGNTAIFVLGVLGGAVLEIWGGWQWWAAAQKVNLLKVKRYDIVLRPTLLPSSDGNIVLGYKISLRF